MLNTAPTFNPDRLAAQVAAIHEQNARTVRLDGWFIIQELRMQTLQAWERDGVSLSPALRQARLLEVVCRELPLTIRAGEIFAGTQADAFARTYALINPAFRVETFAGYCDPTAVFDDITPDPARGLTQQRIDHVRAFWAQHEYAQALGRVYAETGVETGEVVYFVEQVTGHTIADFRPALAQGLPALIAQTPNEATAVALNAALLLADRYAELAEAMAAAENDPVRQAELRRITRTCRRVLRTGATDLYEAMQAYILLWMTMAIEQAPNPYAFSVGNLDRILQPYFVMAPIDHEVAVELTRHFLTLFNVGDRHWAISQNIMVGGRDAQGHDLTCDMTMVVLDAFYSGNMPQPALSVKLHAHTPDAVYQAMEPFFTTPGSVTPSLFNDDVLFDVLRAKGIADDDLADYAIAGCQEPLIMGQESGNTTNSWLNLAKVLELTLHGGKSAISGAQIGLGYAELGLDPQQPLRDMARVKAAFWRQLDYMLPRMARAANACTQALALLPVPFLSAFMGGLASGIDMRDTETQGTKYNASGCLIHGLSLVADSLAAIETLAHTAPQLLEQLPAALANDFAGFESLRHRALAAPKYGNDLPLPDELATEIAEGVSRRILALRNPWGNPFLPDWSTPSTHVLYGYWVGATPDGRKARTMLGYGIDPTAGMATGGFPTRVLSMHKLPYRHFLGGYASHIGLDRAMLAEAGARRGFMAALRDYVLAPLFGYRTSQPGGYYVYFNIDSADHLRAVLADPQQYAPTGIYIMRIHGTFVNFLDLSPAIQEDIITRLDSRSTRFAPGADA